MLDKFAVSVFEKVIAPVFAMGTKVLEVILFRVNLKPFDNYCFSKYLVSEFYEFDAPKALPTSMKKDK